LSLQNTAAAQIADRWTEVPVSGKAYHRIWEASAEGAPLPRFESSPQAEIGISYFSDVHGRIFPDQAQEASLIERLAAQASRSDLPTLLLGGGDDHGGGSSWDLGMAENQPSSFSYRLLRHSGVDAFTLGNHDLDWGQAALVSALKESAMRPLVTNLKRGTELARLCVPALVVEFATLRVGMLGLANCSHVIDAQRHFIDPIGSIAPWLGILETRVDTLIVVSHLGNNVDPARDDRALLPLLPPSALVCSSHSHQVIPPVGDSWSPGNYLQSGLHAQHHGAAKWSASHGWLLRNSAASSLAPLQSTLLCSEFQAKRALIISRRGTARTPGDTDTMQWVANMLGDWSRKHRADSRMGVFACLCARFASSQELPREPNIEDWYRTFQYADRITSFDMPSESLPIWMGFNRDRLEDPRYDPREHGYLYFDDACPSLAKEPLSCASVTVFTHAFVASGAGGYGAYLDRCKVDRDTVKVHDLSLREVLWGLCARRGQASP